MNRFKELVVWQKSIDFTIFIYSITGLFSKEEKYTLVSQINRACICISIPSNIAEGAGRNSKKEFSNFLGIAIGSSFELETQLIISHKLSYVKDEPFNKAIMFLYEIQNMIFKLQKALDN